MPRNRLKKSLLLSLVCAFMAPAAQALQVMEGVEGKTLFVKVSLRDLNRISIEGGRVRLVKSADEGLLTGSADAATGQALIQPLTKDPFGIFVFGQSGKTYTLVLQPEDIPGETIVIKEAAVPASVASTPGEIERAADYQLSIKKMIQALAGASAPEGLEVSKTWEEIHLWEGSRFALERVLTGYSLVGEQYRLFNVGDAPMRIAEQEFYKKGVLAVSVRDLSIDPGRSTQVFVVKHNEGVR